MGPSKSKNQICTDHVEREREVYLEAEADSSSSQWRMCLTLRLKMVADCLTSLLSSNITALTPATVRIKFVNAISLLPLLFDGELQKQRQTVCCASFESKILIFSVFFYLFSEPNVRVRERDKYVEYSIGVSINRQGLQGLSLGLNGVVFLIIN